MAILTNVNVIPLGDRHNRKQSIVMVPAEAAADKPGLLCLQDVDDSGVVGEHYLWFDSSNALRYHTSIPTNQDSDGTSVTATLGADTALSNIASVAIPNAGDLLPANAGQVSVGSATKWMSDVFFGSDLYHQTATFDTKLSFTTPAADRVYTFPDAGAAADVMLDTGAANVIAYTKGTSTIAMAANADLDIATGITVNIDNATTIQGNLTVSATCTLDQNLSTASAPGFATGVTIGNLTLANGSVTDSSGAISFGNENLTTTGTINIGADNVKMTWGASGAMDAGAWFDGAGNMMLYDSNLGVARTLTEMYSGTTLNPTVTGNLTIQDGNFTWTNSSAAETAVWTLAATTVDGIQIASSNTTADVLQITANATNSGNLISLNATDATITSGAYIYCYDGAAQDFAVRRYGATTIAGNAATTVLTVTAGHILASAGNITATLGDIVATAGNVNVTLGNVALTDGNVTTAEGKIEATNTADEISFIKRNNATGTGPVFEVEETNAAGGVAFLVDSDHTGASDAQQITYDGTASGLNITNTAVTGTQLTLVGPAAQTTAVAYYSGDWDGATDVGVIDITSTGTHVHANTSLVYLDHNTGAPAASARGSVLRINDTTANAADAWVAYIGTTNNDGLLITTGAVADINLKLTGIQAQVGQMIHIDGSTGTGWDGANDTGMLHLNALDQVHVGSTLLFVDSAAAPIAAAEGACARFIQSAGAAVTNGYLVEISATATGGALNVSGGFSTFAEQATFTSGLATVVDVTDIASGSTPTNLEAIAAFGAAATVGAGFIGIVDDAGGHATEALVWSDGTKFWYVTGTACA